MDNRHRWLNSRHTVGVATGFSLAEDHSLSLTTWKIITPGKPAEMNL